MKNIPSFISHHSSLKRKTGDFTLVELLVVVAIIAILAGMLLPAINKARDKAKEIQCVNDMKTIGTAFFSYIGDYNDGLPPASTYHHYLGKYMSIKQKTKDSQSDADAAKKYVFKPGDFWMCPAIVDPTRSRAWNGTAQPAVTAKCPPTYQPPLGASGINTTGAKPEAGWCEYNATSIPYKKFHQMDPRAAMLAEMGYTSSSGNYIYQATFYDYVNYSKKSNQCMGFFHGGSKINNFLMNAGNETSRPGILGSSVYFNWKFVFKF